ncbi:hypothetical protein Tco_1054429 [Tanacetum coccineum]|uniref:MAK10-like protein n=1 Tax=Tanacetum coccineum TaxID=301880 RepID=A0ABQ5GWQ3_9ASTR
MDDPEQDFVEYASLRTDEAGVLPQFCLLVLIQIWTHNAQTISKVRSTPSQSIPRNKVTPMMRKQKKVRKKKRTAQKISMSTLPYRPIHQLHSSPKKSSNSIHSSNSSDWFLNHSTPRSFAQRGDDGKVMFIELIRKNDDSSKGEPEEEGSTTTEGVGAEYFDIFPTRSELAYHKYLMCSPIPSIFLRNPIVMDRCPSNLKIPCNIGHVHMEKAYIDPNSPLNIMTRMMYNWIMKRKLDPRENSNRGISNFTVTIKGMYVFVGNFTYIVDFMIVEDISSIIDHKLSQLVLGKPFVEISNMTHDPLERVARFTNRTDEVAYKMPHMIEQYNSLSDLEKEHTKSVYLRNEEDKRRGVELYLMRRSLEVLRKFHCIILGGRFHQLSHVSSPLLSKPGEY